MLAVLLPMATFLLVAAITPGPVNFIATSTGASHGFSKTLPHVLGASASYCLICLAAGTGLSGILASEPDIALVMRLSGAAFLLYMAWRIAGAPVTGPEESTDARPPRFFEGFLAQGLNPKAWLAALSGAGLFVTVQAQPLQYLILYCGLAFVICFGSIGTWAGLGQALQAFLAKPGRARLFNRVMGALLAACVAMMFIQL